MANCYVKAYFDWIEQTAALSDAERGRLFVSVLEYARSGTLPNLSGKESILFPVFKSQLDRDERLSAVRAEAGKRGGEAKESKAKQNLAKCSKTPNKEKEEEKDKDKEKESTEKKMTPPSLDEVRAYVSERELAVDPVKFWTYFDAGNWIDSKGNPVRNWKQKILTWDKKGGTTNDSGRNTQRTSKWNLDYS